MIDTGSQNSDNLNSKDDKFTFCKELLNESLSSVVQNIDKYRIQDDQINLVSIQGSSLHSYLNDLNDETTNKIDITLEFKHYIVDNKTSYAVRREQMIIDDSKFYVTD